MVSKDRTATQAVSSEDFIGYVVAEDITHIATESVGVIYRVDSKMMSGPSQEVVG